ncbi:MAG: hypothetical protein NZ473_07140 [Candidatus Kapabacteria bacterium]|nr:hypothetical protein [Candidatus Kapabacteria bacterium]MCS7169174.1 hypothetical protein [Candidatus Kapabacteria bacterium]MDW7997631.1 hypothetical protein [Bacteroidota bacterium]MDW8226027.1 hypothetical protein [Bacteroidota bacterium]
MSDGILQLFRMLFIFLATTVVVFFLSIAIVVIGQEFGWWVGLLLFALTAYAAAKLIYGRLIRL